VINKELQFIADDAQFEQIVNDALEDVRSSTLEAHEMIMNELPKTWDEAVDPVYDLLGDLLPIGGPLCVQRHCSGPLAGCLANDICRANFACASKCDPNNSTCSFYCSESYKSPTIDAVMHCIFEEYHCVDFPEPSPSNNATCREPID
jgi:hypothetical protein